MTDVETETPRPSMNFRDAFRNTPEKLQRIKDSAASFVEMAKSGDVITLVLQQKGKSLHTIFAVKSDQEQALKALGINLPRSATIPGEQSA